MLLKLFCSMRTLLIAISIFISSLSAYTLQIPSCAVRYPSNLGSLQVIHDDHNGWSIIDNEEREIAVENCDVDQNIRFIENEDLEKVLGYVQYELSCIDLSTQEVIEKWSVQTNGYLHVTTDSDGAYNIRMAMRGPGGGPIAGLLIGGLIKCVGYGVIIGCGGPVGWSIAAGGLASTAFSAGLGAGLNKIAKVASGAKGAVTMTKQLKETEKAVRHYNESFKALQQAKAAYDKAKTVKRFNQLKNAAETCQQLKKIADAKSMATATVATAKGGSALLNVKNAAQSGNKAGNLVNGAINTGTAVALPPVAIVNMVGDFGQMIGDFLPCW